MLVVRCDDFLTSRQHERKSKTTEKMKEQIFDTMKDLEGIEMLVHNH